MSIPLDIRTGDKIIPAMTEMKVPEKYQSWVLSAMGECWRDGGRNLDDVIKFLESADVFETDDQLSWEDAHSITLNIVMALANREEGN